MKTTTPTQQFCSSPAPPPPAMLRHASCFDQGLQTITDAIQGPMVLITTEALVGRNLNRIGWWFVGAQEVNSWGWIGWVIGDS